MDEFKYWSESTKFFWWSVKNKNAYFQKPIDKFDMGFMITFSKDEIRAVTATKSTYTSEHFKWFLLKLIENNSEDTFIFMDNAPIHKASSIIELCKNSNFLYSSHHSVLSFLKSDGKVDFIHKVNNSKNSKKRKINNFESISECD